MSEKIKKTIPIVYNDICLELPKGPVMQTHGIVMDFIQGRDSTQNMDWTDFLRHLPFRTLEKDFPDTYEAACRIFSLLKLDYQVNNGGLYQYFDNCYHEERKPHSENDTHHLDINIQKNEMLSLAKFAEIIYPDRTDDNRKFYEAAQAFQSCYLDEHVEEYETIYSDADEYLYDEENDQYIENPAYEEPYEALIGYEDVVRDEEYFDDKHTEISRYLEELLELKSQYVVKDFIRELEKNIDKHNKLLTELQKVLPASAFNKLHDKGQDTIASMIQNAKDRTDCLSPDKQAHSFTPER